eukprot:XP_019921527.1 PREDICTED: endo-1,4-beta-xylanase S20-like [Crassostrea gigas]
MHLLKTKLSRRGFTEVLTYIFVTFSSKYCVLVRSRFERSYILVAIQATMKIFIVFLLVCLILESSSKPDGKENDDDKNGNNGNDDNGNGDDGNDDNGNDGGGDNNKGSGSTNSRGK